MSIATDPAAAATCPPAPRPPVPACAAGSRLRVSARARAWAARATERGVHRLQRGDELAYRSKAAPPGMARLLAPARERLSLDGCSEATRLRPGAIRCPRHSAARLLPGAVGACLSLGKQ